MLLTRRIFFVDFHRLAALGKPSSLHFFFFRFIYAASAGGREELRSPDRTRNLARFLDLEEPRELITGDQ